MILPKFKTTMLVVSFLLSIHWIFLGISYFISFGWKGVGCTLMHNNPPVMFSNKLGSLLLKLGWQPRKPSIPSNLLVSLISRIVLIRPLRLDDATWIFLGRMALPLCGTFCPLCTFWTLINDVMGLLPPSPLSFGSLHSAISWSSLKWEVINCKACLDFHAIVFHLFCKGWHCCHTLTLKHLFVYENA